MTASKRRFGPNCAQRHHSYFPTTKERQRTVLQSNCHSTSTAAPGPNFQTGCVSGAPLMLLLPQHHPHGPPSHWLGRQALHHLGQHCVQSGGTQGTTKLHPHTHTLVCFTEPQKHGYNITNHRSTGYSYQKNQIKTMQRQSLSPINFKMPNIEI